MSQTWLLFEDGSHYTVFCTPYPMPKGTSKPVDAYILTEPVGDFTIAAQKAVHAVFASALNRNITLPPVNAGFDLEERVEYEADIIGRSGGLSFAVAFARQVLNTDPMNIAATGVIQGNGDIGGVRGIQNKMDTAAGLLEAEDLLLFPRENLDEIPEELLNRLKEKKINAVPVSHMDEVVDIILGKPKEPAKGSSTRLILLTILLVVTLAAWAVFHMPKPATKPLIVEKAPVIEPSPQVQSKPKPPAAKPHPEPKPEVSTGLPTPIVEITPSLPPEKPVEKPPVKVKAEPEQISEQAPASQKTAPAVPPPLPPPGPEGDMGFE